jgi:predicted transcriptional regulator
MNNNFPFEKKKKLADRIQKLSEKSELQQIKSLIAENNPDLPFMKNSNGYFLQFQNLSEPTYSAISKYLDKLDKKKLQDIESEMVDNSEILSDEINALTDEISERNISKKLRLTNTESHILNRVKYEKELKKNEANSDEPLEYYNYDKPTSHEPTLSKQSEEIFVEKQTKKKISKK